MKIKSNDGVNTFTIRNNIISSQFFLAPINTGFALNGDPGPQYIDFYKRRSNGSIGITYIGNVSIGQKWTTNKTTAYFNSHSTGAWQGLALVIAEGGSLPGVQLGCRLSGSKPLKSWMTKDKKSFIANTRLFLSEISANEIKEIISFCCGKPFFQNCFRCNFSLISFLPLT